MSTRIGGYCDTCLRERGNAAHSFCDAFPQGIPVDVGLYKSDDSPCNDGIGYVPDPEAIELCGYPPGYEPGRGGR